MQQTCRVRWVAACFSTLTLLAMPAHAAVPAALPDGVRANVRQEPLTATVGDPIKVQVEVTHPPALRVEIPKPAGQLGEFSVLAFSPGTTRRTDGSPLVRDSAVLVIAAYKTGALEVPGIQFKIITPEGKQLQFETSPAQIRIQSVLTGANPQLKDLKKQADIDEPFPLRKWVLLIGTSLMVAALLWWWLRRRRPVRIAAMSQPGLDPMDVAEAELRDLLNRGLPEKGFIKEFYVSLSEIVRKMLEGGYQIPTAEKTTTEIMEGLRETVLHHPDPARLARIEALLDACDLVKFARYVPGYEEIEAVTRAAFELLEHCRERHASVSARANPALGAA